MASWTGLIGLGLQGVLARRKGLLANREHWRRQTARIQASQLRKLLARAAATHFGKSHGFAQLTAIASDRDLLKAYRLAVPVSDYEAFRPLVARMREQGESDVLWPGRVDLFAQTSGTTAGDKYIPVSQAMLKSNYRAALDIFANASRFGVSLPGLLTGKALFLGGSTTLETNAHGIQTGDLSGLVTPLIRWPISEIYLPGPKIALMNHWPSKIEAMARACVDADVRMVNGMPSWMLVLFDRVIELAREKSGGRKIASLRDVWPNLRLIVHGGVKYTPFAPRIRQAWSGSADGPDVPHRLELYPASEGFIAMQDEPGDPGLRLLSDIGNFYEFVPLEQAHEPNPPAFTADRVEKGQRYVVCMSTCAGLWRYLIGDVVEFDSIPASLDGSGGDGPARLRIVGRHKHFINAFGENLIVEHIENALAAAVAATGLVVGEFTAGPIYPGQHRDGSPRRAGLELVVETAEPRALDPVRLAAFRDAFDQSLKFQNVDYTTKRTDGVGMAAPTISPVPMGTFHRWMESRGKLGGQHKCPRCANHRDFVDGVLGRITEESRGAAAVSPAGR
jgi:hypothetical protein